MDATHKPPLRRVASCSYSGQRWCHAVCRLLRQRGYLDNSGTARKTPGSQGTYAQPVESGAGPRGGGVNCRRQPSFASTVSWGYLADGSGHSPAGDDFTLSSEGRYPADVVLVDTSQRSNATTLGASDIGRAWTRRGPIGMAGNLATKNAAAGRLLKTIDGGPYDGWGEVAWRVGASSGAGTILR